MALQLHRMPTALTPAGLAGGCVVVLPPAAPTTSSGVGELIFVIAVGRQTRCIVTLADAPQAETIHV